MVPSSSTVDRLKWILQKTMGSPDAFELRRSELKREKVFRSNYNQNHKNKDIIMDHDDGHYDSDHNNNSVDEEVQITDEDVVASYKSSTHPVSGEMGRYLSQGKLSLCLGAVMFMHGSLPFAPPMVVEKCILNLS